MSTERLGALRRAVAVLTVAVGLGLVVLPLAESLFDRTAAGQRVLDGFRHLTADDAGFAQLKEDMDATVASGSQFRNEMAPALAEDLGMSKREFAAFVEADFPRIAAGAAATPEGNAFLEPFVAKLVATKPKFRTVEDAPTAGLPVTTIPWMLVGAGLLLAGIGLAALRTPGRGPLVAVAVLGAGLVVLPLAWSLPGAASDAEKVVDVARPALSPKTTALATELNNATDQIVVDTQVGLIPAVADRTGVPVSELTRRLTREFPATMSYLADWPAIEDRNAVLLNAMSATYPDFRQAERIPFTTLLWLVIGAGIVLVLAAGAALLAGVSTRAPSRPRKVAAAA
jgi:hypothetical protein